MNTRHITPVYLLVGLFSIGLPTISLLSTQNASQAMALVKTAVSNNDNRARSAYYFTFTVPDALPSPINAVTITQREGLDTVKFSEQVTTAYQGDRVDKASEIKLTGTRESSTPGQLTVYFEDPISPGQTVTVATPVKNPNSSGVYLFGIEVFANRPEQNRQFLGLSRIHIADGD